MYRLPLISTVFCLLASTNLAATSSNDSMVGPMPRKNAHLTRDAARRALTSSRTTGRLAAPPTGTGTTMAAGLASSATRAVIKGSFLGIEDSNSGSEITPYCSSAVSSTHVVEIDPTIIRIFDRATGTLLQSKNAQSFWGGLGVSPEVVYDPATDRFFLAVDMAFADEIGLAVTRSSDPTGPWFVHKFDPVQGIDASNVPDAPSLAVTSDGVYLGTYMYPQHTSVFVVEKAPLVAASPSVSMTALRGVSPGGRPMAVRSAIPGTTQYFVDFDLWGTKELHFVEISGPASAPTLNSYSSTLLASNLGFVSSAPQMGGPNLWLGYDSAQNACLIGNEIWFGASTKTTGQTRGQCRLANVDITTRQVTYDTIVSDPVLDYFIPNVNIDSQGNIAMVFNGSSASDYVGSYYTGRRFDDPVGVLDAVGTLTAGGGFVHVNGTNGWGTTSSVVVDPTDGIGFYATATHSWPGDQWQSYVYDLQPDCLSPVSYCTTSPNSAGAGALMAWEGPASVSNNDFRLVACDMPANQFGIFFYGGNQISVPFGDGFRCVGGSIYRLNISSSNGAGVMKRSLDVTSPPIPAGQITSGSTWNFQAWYRDVAGGPAGFNLSDGMSVLFCD